MSDAPYPRRRIAGAVEQFKRDRVAGWIAVPADAPPTRVSLELNGAEVAATWVREPFDRNNYAGGETRPFRIWLRDLWDYVGPADELVVVYNGSAVPIAGHGMLLRPERAGAHGPADLMAKLAAGHVFGQKGELQLSKKLDLTWQRDVLAQFDRVRTLLRSAHGYEAFFMYGSLLGVVRENGFIGHDLDFDAAYVSTRTDGPAAAAELREIAGTFIEQGYAVGSRLTHLHITDPAGTRIDLFHLYFDADGALCFPFGVAGTGAITAPEWQGTTERPFSAGTAVVPVIAERMVEHVYGADWAQPKPGFMWYLDRTQRALEGVMPEAMVEDIYWDDFYSRTGFDTPSPFAAAVLARPDLAPTVIDLGCGDGRDAVAFAAAGRRVLGLDRSAMGVRRAAARTPGGSGPRFEVCDLSDAAALRAVLATALDRADGPVLFYLRFLLQSVTAETQEALLETIGLLARPGDQFAAEFRTPADEGRPTVHGDHFRRYQDGPALAATLSERYGFDVVNEQSGTGLSPYQDEDPELYRLIAIRAPRPTRAADRT